MVIHATAKAMEAFNLKSPDKLTPSSIPLAKRVLERDLGSGLYEWGLDCFEFMGRSCLVIINFASRFTIFVFGATEEVLENLGNYIIRNISEVYAGDFIMTQCLNRMFTHDKYLVYKPIQNRLMLSALEQMTADYAAYGARFHRFMDYGSVIHMRAVNHDVNFNHSITVRSNGKDIQRYAGPYFRELVIAKYGTDQNL